MNVKTIDHLSFLIEIDGRSVFALTRGPGDRFYSRCTRRPGTWTMTAPDSEPVSFVETTPNAAARFVVRAIARGITNAIRA